jgi:hypothetical protein
MQVHAGVETITNEINKTGACEKNYTFGKRWIEWRIRHVSDVTYVSQTVYFCPRGLLGFLYWYMFYPFHMLHFRGLIRRIARQGKTQ